MSAQSFFYAPRKLARINILVLLSMALATSACCFGQEDEHLVEVSLVFRNYTSGPVVFRYLEESGEEVSIAPLPNDDQQPLAEGRQREYPSFAGLTWVIEQEGKTLAFYTCDERPRQIIDIAELVKWQTPVKINFRNSTDAAVNIWYSGPDEKDVLIIENMPAGTELKNPDASKDGDGMVVSLPGRAWTVEQNGEFLGNYFPNTEPVQDVDLANLKTWFQPVEIVFANNTKKDLHVYFEALGGELICYTKKANGRYDPLKPGESMRQPAAPLQRWIVKSGDKEIADYIATNQKEQECSITEEFVATRE